MKNIILNIKYLYLKMIRLIAVNNKVKNGDAIATLFAIKSYEAQDRVKLNFRLDMKSKAE